MRIEQNTISRDWTVLYKGRRFFVNFTESDGQTLALCNRDNWEIEEETEDGIREFHACLLKSGSPQEEKEAREKAKIMDKLIAFCVRNWDNWFIRALKKGWREEGPF